MKIILNLILIILLINFTNSLKIKTNYNLKFNSNNSNNKNNQDYYIGAVVEYSPKQYNFNDPNETPVNYILSNIKEYNEYVIQAKEQGAQIIVFPEYGLLGGAFATRDEVLPYLEVIPEPNPKEQPIIPCDNDEYSNRTILQSLSCIAQQNSIVLVVDMGDVQYCTNDTVVGNICPSDGRLQYNTQVAFSKDGEILAKYHKSHLYGEPFFNPSIPPIPTVFTTDFNVTFGMLICFDILFKEPQEQLVQNYSIKNLVYSTEWVNVNYAYAREIQESWSKLNNANVLAANIGSASVFSGSGIYSNGNYLESVLNPTNKPLNKLLVSKIPKDPSNQLPSSIEEEEQQDIEINLINDKQIYFNYKPFSHQSFGSNLGSPTSINATIIPFTIQANQINQSITSVNNDFTCTFIYSTSSKVEEGQMYALISFNGFFNGFFNAQLCSASKCGSNDPSSCFDNVFDSLSTFDQISLFADFTEGYRINPTVTTDPLIENYLENYQLGDKFLNISNFKQYFVGASLFAIQWN